ncbi:MAG: hypothetical protein NWP33_03205 [Burkholderiaceae bacterium]|jgi:hypothetical protein|nr:hypothetical protein [Burkholderiaceae bacterium]MDP5127123.1 hypothetical protein [Burkholderiaceae bacterium]
MTKPSAQRLATLLLSLGLHMPVWALDFSDIAKEGELVYLEKHPEPNSYHYESRVFLTESSLQDGIVSLSTCHYRLDPIRKVVIAFNPDRLQSLAVESHSGIESIAQDKHSVTLSNVKKGAQICITLRSKALDLTEEKGVFKLQAGPLMRRYFDGYLPMSARLKVNWPAGLLQMKASDPLAQPGVTVHSDPEGAEMLITFAGKFTGHFALQDRR